MRCPHFFGQAAFFDPSTRKETLRGRAIARFRDDADVLRVLREWAAGDASLPDDRKEAEKLLKAWGKTGSDGR